MLNSRFVSIVLLLLAGCASAPQSAEVSATRKQPEVGVVYIYRLHTPPYKQNPVIKVGDVTVAELPTDSYTVLRLKPGTYTITADWGPSSNKVLGKSATLSVEPGRSYFVDFAGKLGLVGTMVTYSAHAMSGATKTMPAALAACSYVAPKKVSTLAPK